MVVPPEPPEPPEPEPPPVDPEPDVPPEPVEVEPVEPDEVEPVLPVVVLPVDDFALVEAELPLEAGVAVPFELTPPLVVGDPVPLVPLVPVGRLFGSNGAVVAIGNPLPLILA